MKKTTRITIAILLVACSQALANFSGGDDFNDNDIDSGKWDVFYEPHDHLSQGGMNEVTGRLETWGYRGEAIAEWIANTGSYTQDWAVVIDAHNADNTRIAGMYVSFGPSHGWVNIEHHRSADITNRHVVLNGHSASDDDVADVYDHSVAITNDTVQLGLAFDASTKTIYGAFNLGSGFVPATNFNIASVGMVAGDVFSLGLYAGTESSVNVTSGTLYFDNFEAVPNAGFLNSDSDGDDLDFLDEQIAGTDPNSAGSVFKVLDAEPSPSGFVLNWTAIEGRAYTVRWTDSLTNGFQTLETDITHPQNSYTDTVHAVEGGGFYNLKVDLVMSPLPAAFQSQVVGTFLPNTPTYFTSATRFIWDGTETGNWSYTKTGLDTALLVFTYDEDGNDPAIYREEIILTYTGKDTGTFRYSEFNGNVEDPASVVTGPFTFL